MKPGDRVRYYRQRRPQGWFAATFVRQSSPIRVRIELDEPLNGQKLLTVDPTFVEPYRELTPAPAADALSYAQGSFGTR